MCACVLLSTGPDKLLASCYVPSLNKFYYYHYYYNYIVYITGINTKLYLRVIYRRPQSLSDKNIA